MPVSMKLAQEAFSSKTPYFVGSVWQRALGCIFPTGKNSVPFLVALVYHSLAQGIPADFNAFTEFLH